MNPVFLLDEVDKMSMDFRGDPSSALLEVLDPEQNHSFLDHYLDVEYDLSKVMFIATANVVRPDPAGAEGPHGGHRALRLHAEREAGDRAAVPRAASSSRPTACAPTRSSFEDERDHGDVIEGYTREAGVRNLEREIGVVCRKIARRIVQEERRDAGQGRRRRSCASSSASPSSAAGARARSPRSASRRASPGPRSAARSSRPRVASCEGKGKLTLTGKLGEVMQESARAAVSYVRSRAELFGVDPDFHEKLDIHIHVPEGAIPKDGPSAGITMATALVSAVTKIPVRKDVAMTGEITLRGKVLPVGGIKDKVLAAYRAGITHDHPAAREREGPRGPAGGDPRRDGVPPASIDMDEVLRLALEGRVPAADAETCRRMASRPPRAGPSRTESRGGPRRPAGSARASASPARAAV